MINAVIMHGKPPQARYENPNELRPHEANWLPWLGRQLTSGGCVEVSIPALPKPYYPVYKDWKAEFEKSHVGPQTAVIGHSAGAEFILRWLSENREVSTEKVVLVAPYCDYEAKYGDFSQYELDADIAKRTGRITVFYSPDDDPPITRRADELLATIHGSVPMKLEGFGHFRIGHNMLGEEFPQLLQVLQA
ncbi:MAG TPA: alpha/beta hydrolase [Candidatus Saccharimonadales bacterium]|jgi:hypothetical protein